MKNQLKVGTLLISKPFMEDKRFEKTIIIIVEHNENGTVGFVINKQELISLHELIPTFPKKITEIKRGGPVEKNSLFFIHKHPDLIHNSIKIKDGFFWGGEIEDLIKRINNNEIKIHEISFFLGYAGWEKNQLESEIKEGSWILHELNLSRLDQKTEWSNLLIEINKEYEVWAKAPSDYHLN